MASNLAYKDKTPAQKISKKTLNKMVWRSLNLQMSFNYERMQAAGWLWALLPGLEEIHTNKEDLATSMTHNMEFFNTHPFLVTFVLGIVLSMEQNKADINSIRGVRVAAMGPLGGIGDALFWFTLVPVTAGITANMAINGSIAGPIIFFIITFGVQMALRFFLMYWSYDLGTTAITTLTKNAREFTHAASMLGVFVVGALTCNYGATKLGILIPNGETAVKTTELVIEGSKVVQKEVEALQPAFVDIQSKIDGILPAAIPLALTLLAYYLIKKKGWSPTKCIFLFLVLGIVGAIFGIWDGDYTSLVSVPWHS